MQPSKKDLANIITSLVSTMEPDGPVCGKCGAKLYSEDHKHDCICAILNNLDDIVIGGVYEHCKGNSYVVTGLGRSSEDCTQEMVIYKSLKASDYPAGTTWIRPLDMFLDNHSSGVKRFTYKGMRYD